MKKLRIGFAAIVAILAISVTIAAQAGAFETKIVRGELDCFDLNVTVPTGAPVEIRLNCPDDQVFLDNTIDCTNSFNGEPIFDLDPAEIVANPTEACPSTSGKLCCLFIAEGSVCLAQPEIEVESGDPKKYIVSSVRCKIENP